MSLHYLAKYLCSKNRNAQEVIEAKCLHLLLKNDDFLNTDISQSSVATRLGCGGVFVYDFFTNFLLSLTAKEFWKSANIW